MEAISLKLENSFSHDIEKFMKKHRYTTKTEFIREAIRDKLKVIRKENALEELKKYFGKAKAKTSYEEERKIREEVSKKFAKKFGVNLN